MKIVLDTTAAEWIFANFKKWDTIGDEKFDFPNWKRSPIDRENRRESIVYGNCADLLSGILMNAVDENGVEWWTKLILSEQGVK